MDIKEIEKYWIESSEDAFDTAKTLLENNKFVYSMFFLHLSIEKMLKALFANHNQTEAPFGHNLQKIASKIKSIDFGKNRMELFAQITTFNIAGRYDDYKNNFRAICNLEFATNYLNKGKELLEWLKSQIK